MKRFKDSKYSMVNKFLTHMKRSLKDQKEKKKSSKRQQSYEITSLKDSLGKANKNVEDLKIKTKFAFSTSALSST